MDDFGAVKTVELGRRSDAVGTDVLGVQKLPDFQIFRKLGGEGNLVKTVAGGPDHRADLFFPAPEGMKIREPMIVNDSREGMIDPVVDMIKNLPVSVPPPCRPGVIAKVP